MLFLGSDIGSDVFIFSAGVIFEFAGLQAAGTSSSSKRGGRKSSAAAPQKHASSGDIYKMRPRVRWLLQCSRPRDPTSTTRYNYKSLRVCLSMCQPNHFCVRCMQALQVNRNVYHHHQAYRSLRQE